jgi:hypothetical protein
VGKAVTDTNRPPPTADGDSDGDGASAGARPGRRRRRVVVPPPEGTDPTPEGEPEQFPGDENDERLHQDVPPHWGERGV